jgi:hypothetical protein
VQLAMQQIRRQEEYSGSHAVLFCLIVQNFRSDCLPYYSLNVDEVMILSPNFMKF